MAEAAPAAEVKHRTRPWKPTPHQRAALEYITAHQGCWTRDLLQAVNREIKYELKTLETLINRNLVARQLPPGYVFGEFESKWYVNEEVWAARQAELAAIKPRGPRAFRAGKVRGVKVRR